MEDRRIRTDAAPEDQPPPPPKIQRRFQLERAQWIGIPLMLLIPILAVFGLFGNRPGEAHVVGDRLAVRVEYPSRLHYGVHEVLQIALRNESEQPIPSATVGLDRHYVEAFTNVTFTPEAEDVTDREYRIPLGTLAPGEERTVRVELEPVVRWKLEGRIRVLATGRAPIVIALETFVFP